MKTKANELTAGFTLTVAAKKKLLKALRSGKYKQGRDALFEPDNSLDGPEKDGSFCCLGVFCHAVLDIPVSFLVYTGYPEHVDHPAVVDIRGEIGDGPGESDFWWVLYKGKRVGLDALNDSGMSFKQIANIIHRQVPTH